jgi:site-specific DNA recombinase
VIDKVDHDLERRVLVMQAPRRQTADVDVQRDVPPVVAWRRGRQLDLAEDLAVQMQGVFTRVSLTGIDFGCPCNGDHESGDMSRRRQSLKDFSDLEGMRGALYCRVSHIDKSGGKDAGEKRRAADEKSVDDQEREGRGWAERARVRLVRVFRDPGLSASPFAPKGRGREARPEFDQMLSLVEAGEVDVVWVWAIDRSNRDLRVFTEIRDLFQAHQVALVVSGRLHDPNNYDDWMMLGFTSQFGERFSFELSKNVRRGLQSNADAGKPHGVTPYGYRRRRADTRPKGVPDEQIWIDKRTKQFAWQEPNYFNGDGKTIAKDSPAHVVQEIFRRVAAGDPIVTIEKDLNARNVPAPVGGEWRRVTIRKIATNPAYIGRRVHQGRVIEGVSAMWPALPSEEEFDACQRILTDPLRTTTRPARARHLLSWLARCAECGGQLAVQKVNHPNWQHRVYTCWRKHCVAIKQQTLDDYVERAMVRWLSDPRNAEDITRGEDSDVARQARAEAAQLRIDLGEWRQLAEAGEVSPTGYAHAEKGLLRRIADAEQRALAATVPAVLAGNIGPQAEAGWARLDVAVKRQIIRAVADIRLRRVGVGQWRSADMEDRLEWEWLIGPDAGQDS